MKYVSITQTKCGRCRHLKETRDFKKGFKVVLVGYKCKEKGNFWYSTDKVHETFGEGCNSFEEKPSEAQK